MAWDRNSANYPRAVAQFDATACWAASLEWWLRCMQRSRTIQTQLNLINRFVAHWNHDENSSEYGTIDGEGLGRILEHDSISMNYIVRARTSWDKDFVNEKLAISPVMIGYYELQVNGFHVNVIHSLNDAATADVNVMEPNRGRFRTRNNSRYTSRNYVLSWAK